VVVSNPLFITQAAPFATVALGRPNMIVYVLVKIEDLHGEFTVDPLGVYTDADNALNWIDKLASLNTNPNNVAFDALEYETDEEPILLSFMKQEREKLIDMVDATLASLIKKEMIEQYIGEDGNFCYELTTKGRSAMSGIPGKILKDFINSKK
jgi:hypothetical protein